MRAFSRSTLVFAVALVLIAGFGLVSRELLHLDCLGPVLPGWGCLAVPLPDTLDQATITSGDVFRWLLVAIGLYAVCLALGDIVSHAAARVLRLLFPGWLQRSAAAAQPPRSYRWR